MYDLLTACSRVILRLTIVNGAAGFVRAAQPRSWLTEPVRLFQTNLPENHSTLDPGKLVNGVVDFGANVLLFNMGGIGACIRAAALRSPANGPGTSSGPTTASLFL